MDETSFFVTGPGDTDGTLIVVAIVLFLIILGFGALYFTIQAWPDQELLVPLHHRQPYEFLAAPMREG